MFGSIGMPELLVIFIIALIFIGPKKLPEIGKAIGKGISEFRKATQEIKESIEVESESTDIVEPEEPIDSIAGTKEDKLESTDAETKKDKDKEKKENGDRGEKAVS